MLGENRYGEERFGRLYPERFHSDQVNHSVVKKLRWLGVIYDIDIMKLHWHHRFVITITTRWEECPLESQYRNRVAFRLGTSCVLCGKIQRGFEALTERRRAREWLGVGAEDLSRSWLPPLSAAVWEAVQRGNGLPWFYPNPLCPQCWHTWGNKPLPVSKIILLAVAKQLRKKVAA
jgi:hypothetical protein